MSRIEDIKEKTAENIAKADFPQDDPYHRTIQRAARYLVACKRDRMEYQTQWASGTTLWAYPISGHCETITLEALDHYGF